MEQEPRGNDNDFLFEEIERYKFSYTNNAGTVMNTSNDLDHFVRVFNQVIEENIKEDKDIIVSIFDYEKNTNIYYYDSKEERC